MVSTKADGRQTVKTTISFLIIFVAFFFVFYAVANFIFDLPDEQSVPEIVDEPELEEPEEPQIVLPDAISFQGVIDQWVGSVSGNKSVLIYDLDLDSIAGAYNVEESYSTESLYKLFVVYEAYRRVQNGTWDGNELISGRRTILECMDLAIRESNSSCAEPLWGAIGHAELDEIIRTDFDITNSNISNLLSNVTDIMKIMKIFYEHTEITDENLIALMKDSFLNQPITTYNWRQGLPSGFSNNVLVYDKVGWRGDGARWLSYHDAAILDFPNENRHFIVVVMTNYVSHRSIANFGSMIENYYNSTLVSTKEL